MIATNGHGPHSDDRVANGWFPNLGDFGRWWSAPPTEQPWLAHYPAGVPHHLSYPRQRLGWLLEQIAERFPDRVACHYYHESLTYEQLLDRARRLAMVLVREGVQPGDRVGVLLPNLPETLVTLFGVWIAGGTVVSLSPLMVADEVQAFVKSTDCRIVVTLDVLAPLVMNGPEPPQVVIASSLAGRLTRLETLGYAWIRFQRIGFGNPPAHVRQLRFDEALDSVGQGLDAVAGKLNAPAFILPTGGTTGAPKAVTLSHQNLIAQAWQLSHWSRGRHGEESILAVLPFFHSYGLSTSVMVGMAMGATLVLHHRFIPASVVRLIEQHRPSIFMAVPAMLSALNTKVLRDKSCDLRSLKAVMSGGAPLPSAVAEEFQERTGAVVVEGYGLSEASPVTHANPLDGSGVPGTIGLPMPDTDARIVNPDTGDVLPHGTVGELIVRGPQVMLGYWNDQAATDRVLRNGWLHTGDLGTMDERGYFKIVDRIKDLIITSGFNVYPADVEEVLRTYPGVKDVAVVGVPDQEKGELVKAILVVDSQKKFHRREFDDFARHKLAAHKRPKLVEVQEADLPRNFLGKVLRRELRPTDAKPPAETPAAS